MESTSLRFRIGLALLGLALIGVSWYYSQKPTTTADFHLRLAWVEKGGGTVSIYRNGFSQKETVERKQPLFNLESVETSSDGEALLVFESLWRLNLTAGSLVTLMQVYDENGSHVVVLIKRGQIKIEQYGRENELFIGKNGERISATDYHRSELSKAPVKKEQPIDEGIPLPESDGLTEKEITEVVSRSRTAYFKCYTLLLQRSSQVKGQVGIGMVIERDGKVQSSEVTAPAAFDEEFRKCAQSVTNKMSFRSFSGFPVSTMFPLVFE